jgi:transposase
MIFRGEPRRVLAYGEPIDMRKGADGLIGVAKQELEQDILGGSLFLFINRRQTLCRVLWWDRTGWCVLSKRLERGKFELRSAERKQQLSEREFLLLLDGVLTPHVRSKR